MLKFIGVVQFRIFRKRAFEESGYKVKLSMVADMLQIVYLEEELEWEKIEEELRKALMGRLSGSLGFFTLPDALSPYRRAYNKRRAGSWVDVGVE